jgi:hypothetical protein
MSVAPGTRLGSYEVIALIGQGGMGVYRARDTKLGRDVALKTLPGTLPQDPERASGAKRTCSRRSIIHTSRRFMGSKRAGPFRR